MGWIKFKTDRRTGLPLDVFLTTPKIQSYIEQRIKDSAANATINRGLAALKRMLSLGAKQYPPKVDRVPHIAMLKECNVRKGFFEHGDAQK